VSLGARLPPLDKFLTRHGGSEGKLERIAGYDLEEKLASGPMSTVYLSTGKDGEPVAVKVLSEHGNRIAAKLSVKLGKPWEGGKERGNYYIVMEYLPGGNLAEHIRVRTPGVMSRRLEILISAASGLAYVHEKSIIHRDVCPKNLLFDAQGTVKLIDFGVAIHKSDRLKQTEIRTGRPSYLAPELIRHNRFNVQTDIYAFGVTLYETFVGRRPFAADTREELMGLHLRSEPVPPSRMDPSIHPEVDRLVLRALEKVPQDRYQTVREVLTALARLKGLTT